MTRNTLVPAPVVPPRQAMRAGTRRSLVPGSLVRLRLFQPLPGWVWAVTFVLTLAGLASQYPLLTASCVLTLPICASLLCFRGESIILFACCGMQWLQVVAAVFYCDIYRVGLEVVLDAPEVEKATWLCVGGILSLASGMRLALNASGRGETIALLLEAEAPRFDIARVFQFWIMAYILGVIAEGIGWRVMAVHQFLVPFYNIKWVFMFMLFYLVQLRNQGYAMLLCAMVFEFLTGFLGWFSTFKEGLIMFLVAALTVRRSMNGRLRLGVIVVIVVGFVTSVFWSSIKMDYRLYVSGGKEGAHGLILKSVTERMNWLADRVSHMDEKTFDNGMRSLLARVQYVTLFGHTLSHVPRFEPHSDGELWLGAVKHVLMPRFIFRDKAVIDDSERARRFTGLRLSGQESGTSIGIGYMAESYADFGSVGMFVPVFLLGVLMGKVYEVALWHKQSSIFGTAIATAILFAVMQAFATSNAKLVGCLVLLTLAYWALNRVFAVMVFGWLTRAR